ncbi:uncharacterized protein [Miscanthus floridulus]|uniref:uncharacterized protein n=1 Tax=Miscanthus floridulus TaxID=154761 RepID=UPI00345B0491
MAGTLYQYYDQVLGTIFVRSRRFDLGLIGLPSVDLSNLEVCFTKAEIWAVISEMSNDKAPGPNGFTGSFYKKAWPIIKDDIVNAFNAFWARDTRSLNLLNDAYMILLRKKEQPEEIRDYRPISLIHSFGKLIIKMPSKKTGNGAGQLGSAKPNSAYTTTSKRLDDLLVLKGAVELFGLASGLFSNLDKSVATPIGCSEQELELVRDTLSCKVETFPCRYLEIPLSIFKLRKGDEQRLVDSVASRIPQWKGRLLNMAGRTALARATLSAIPIHMFIALCLSQWAIEQIDKRRRTFIWCGEQTVTAGKCKVAWKTVYKPRELGGQGVIDL